MNKKEFYLEDTIGIIEEVLSGGGEFRIYPRGTSMTPLIREGKDSVVLKRGVEALAKKGDIAFYRRKDGNFVLHRVIKIEADGAYTMCGDNQTVLEHGILPEQIIGYVSEIYRADKPILGKPLYKLYVNIMSVWPFRKIEHFFRHGFWALRRRLKRGDKK